MVYKKSYRGQRTGSTIRKLHTYLQSTNEGFVDYKLKDSFFQHEPEKLQKIFDRKDQFFSDGRKMPSLLLYKEVDPELNHVPLNFEHRRGNQVVYSLNKYKRWTLPSVVQENIESLSEEDFRVVLHERRSVIEKKCRSSFNIFIGQCNWNDCVKYVDSKTPVSCARPGRSAASYFCDLRRKCMEGGNTGKKPLSRKRIRHNMHSRGVQRKSELQSKRPKVDNHSNYNRYMLLDGADNNDMAEFRYEICVPGKKTSRFKPNRDLREDRLCDRVQRYFRIIKKSKSLLKQKGMVNGHRQNWHTDNWYLRKGYEDESTQGTSVGSCCSLNRKLSVEFETCQKNLLVCTCSWAKCVHCGAQNEEEEEERMEKRATMSVDILDCLKKARYNKRSVKTKEKKRKLTEKDGEFNKKSHIVYLNDPSVEKTTTIIKEEEDSDNSNSAPISESTAEDVQMPNFVKCFLRRSEIEDILRQTPGISSTSSYPMVYLFPLNKSVKYDENENVSNLEWGHNTMNGDVPALEIQETFGSTFSPPEQDIAEYRLRIVGNQQVYNTEKANDKLAQLLTPQEEYLMIQSASAVFQSAQDAVHQHSTDKSILTKDPHKLCQMKSAFDWLPRLTYSVTTIQLASLKNVTSTSFFREVQIEYPTQNMSGIKHEDECGVCFSSLGDSGKDSTEGVVILPCRHSFCRACLLQYLVQNIRTGARRISCMQYKCSSVIDPVTVRSLVPDRLFSQWVYRQQEQAVMSTGNWKWCPSSTCDHILSVVSNKFGAKIPRAHLRIMEVGCVCGTEFCLDCNEAPHWPASCQQIKAYTKALDIQNDLSKEKDYMRSFKVNVKPCPLCKEKVDKNGGCNAMMCRCGHHFCWLCLKPNPYSQHSCKAVPLQEIDIVSVKVLKFHVKFLELAYSYRVQCYPLIKWKEALSRNPQVSARTFEKKVFGVKQDKWMSIVSLKSSQLKHLSFVVETLNLLEKVCISISSTSRKSHAGREFRSLTNTVDFIISRLLELLQVPPNTQTDNQMNRLQNILSKKIKMMVLLSVYLQRIHSKKDTTKTPPTVRYQTVYN